MQYGVLVGSRARCLEKLASVFNVERTDICPRKRKKPVVHISEIATEQEATYDDISAKLNQIGSIYFHKDKVTCFVNFRCQMQLLFSNFNDNKIHPFQTGRGMLKKILGEEGWSNLKIYIYIYCNLPSLAFHTQSILNISNITRLTCFHT